MAMHSPSNPSWVRSIVPVLRSAGYVHFALIFCCPLLLAQMPPGGHVVQFGQPFKESDPEINDSRQVVYRGYQDGPIASTYVYDYESGTMLYHFTDGLYHTDEAINNLGHIGWLGGVFNQNNEVYYFDGAEVLQITSTPYRDHSLKINDLGDMVMRSEPCWLEQEFDSCFEVSLYQDDVLEQISFGARRWRVLTPDINNLVEIAWNYDDWKWSLFNAPSIILRYSQNRILELTSPLDTMTDADINNVSEILWQHDAPVSSAPAYIWNPDTEIASEVLTYGNVIDFNDRGDIIFFIILSSEPGRVAWLKRGNVFYQLFDGNTGVSNNSMNNRGDVAAGGLLNWGAPEDIFLSLIDPIPGDYDEDGDLDLDDAQGFPICMSGPDQPAAVWPCNLLDMNTDSHVDLADAASFMNGFIGNCALGITTAPNGQDVCTGGSVTFSIATKGSPIASWQWRFEGNDIAGATDPTYTINNVNSSHDGEYGIRLTTQCGWEVQSDHR